MSTPAVVAALARSLVAGEPEFEQTLARAVRVLGRPWPWLRPLLMRYVETFGGRARPRYREVIRFLWRDPGFERAWKEHRHRLHVAQWLADRPRMQPAEAAAAWNVPAIKTTGELAQWLSVHPSELEWFADLKGLAAKLVNPKLDHYTYRALRKRSGAVRLIEAPKREIKDLQRRILSLILDRVPAHPAAHGFVKGRSVATFAAPHAGKQAVLRLDLEDFFPAFPAARAQAVFRTLGYPEPVADRLGGICSNATPCSVFRDCPLDISPDAWREARILYGRPHLPQGAPTSPALANIEAYRLDCRLAGLARTAGAAYSRYADDLAFSGGEDFRRAAGRFALHAAAIALEEGFRVNHRKTRIMSRGVRQTIAGVVVNGHPSLPRADLERLEAILTNCVRHGPESQNRDNLTDFRAHLQGRIAYVQMINARKAERLRALFGRIDFA
jgi:hypothetical protein